MPNCIKKALGCCLLPVQVSFPTLGLCWHDLSCFVLLASSPILHTFIEVQALQGILRSDHDLYGLVSGSSAPHGGCFRDPHLLLRRQNC